MNDLDTTLTPVPEKTQHDLEWPAILAHLLEQCETPYGRQSWEQTPFLETEEIRRHLLEVEALQQLLRRYGEPIYSGPAAQYHNIRSDIRPSLQRVSKGGVLTLEEIKRIFGTLTHGNALFLHIRKFFAKEPEFSALASLLADEQDLFETIKSVIAYLTLRLTPDGQLSDQASPMLGRLRHRLKSERQDIQRQLQGYLHGSEWSKALQSPLITERDGRYVLPVRIEFKAMIPGIVHAGSSSGSTVFVEPQPVIELNNRIQGTQGELQQEIQRILEEISTFLEIQSEILTTFLHLLGQADRRLAAARLSIRLDAHVPQIPPWRGKGGDRDHVRLDAHVPEIPLHHLIHLKQARHPLLILQHDKHEKDKQEIVPNDIQLGVAAHATDPAKAEASRTIIITGPNTGGKTVILKTAGLLALMVRAGLPVPAEPGSCISLFDPILVEIGDHQSIEQNLSTFSAHVCHLKSFVEPDLDLCHGLVLIDEITAGTDPAEGSALAKAILDELYQKGALTIVTTHFGELKLEAHHHPGYLNASVEFDPDRLCPTYRLLLGVPGTSNAITIAQRLGLNPAVVDKARNAMDRPAQDSAALIESLESRNRKLQEELKLAESYRKAAQDSYEKLEWEKQQLQEEKRQTLQQFKIGLKSRVHELERQVKKLRRTVQKSELEASPNISIDLQNTASGLKQVEKSADQIFETTYQQVEAEAKKLRVEELSLAEEVFSKRLNVRGVIQQLLPDTREVVLQAGNIKVTVPVSDIERISKFNRKQKRAMEAKMAAIERAHQSQRKPDVSSPRKDPMELGFECDVRGMRVEEAMEKVTGFLDDAALAGMETVGVIHGHGTGALKHAIRDYLQRSSLVKRFHPAEAIDGGDGKTVIELI